MKLLQCIRRLSTAEVVSSAAVFWDVTQRSRVAWHPKKQLRRVLLKGCFFLSCFVCLPACDSFACQWFGITSESFQTVFMSCLSRVDSKVDRREVSACLRKGL